jgi:hypothetical protein
MEKPPKKRDMPTTDLPQRSSGRERQWAAVFYWHNPWQWQRMAVAVAVFCEMEKGAYSTWQQCRIGYFSK